MFVPNPFDVSNAQLKLNVTSIAIRPILEHQVFLLAHTASKDGLRGEVLDQNMTTENAFERFALLASDSHRAREAYEILKDREDWVPLEQADAAIVLGGDGFMLQTLHSMLDSGRVIPAYGMNRGTVGFMMNRYRSSANVIRLATRARLFKIRPLRMDAVTQDGETHTYRAINEVSLLREMRQTAKIEVSVNGRVRIEQLICDGVLLSTPAGSTAYNLSANGPILPLGCDLLALTPISPFRPRRWSGAILPDHLPVKFRILEAKKRPVSAVADQRELRNIAEVTLTVERETELTLLFDKGHSLDERIVAEQFAWD